MRVGELFYFDETYAEKAEWCNHNKHHIEEVESDEKGRRFVIVENETMSEEEILRERREDECFVFVNRGQAWYNTLTLQQQEELNEWYRAWLDVTEIKIVPNKPKWLK